MSYQASSLAGLKTSSTIRYVTHFPKPKLTQAGNNSYIHTYHSPPGKLAGVVGEGREGTKIGEVIAFFFHPFINSSAGREDSLGMIL